MIVIIMGCGRVGAQVARRLDEQGHDVRVIDHKETARDLLGPTFGGQFIEGVGFDREILVQAGIEEATAFAATSSSDNANIVAARIARNVYHVPRVVARLYDPSRAEVYQRLGLVTISSTTWGAQRIFELLAHTHLDPVMTFGHGEVSLVALEVAPALVGRQVNQISLPGEIQVVAITRGGQAIVPLLGTAFEHNDLLHLAVHASAMGRLETLLQLGEGG
ncbi:MAG: TrkA family potassium uptake protein [Anaerolineales bacterium]|nr:TrkA family potassium uptake protein [Anaerolineales bacterium]